MRAVLMLHPKIFFLSILCVFLVLTSFPLAAQILPERSQERERLSEIIPPEDIPLEFLEEMEEINSRCENDGFDNQHRDCRCYAMRFLDERLRYNHVEQNVIHDIISNECYDAARMAGHYLAVCMTGTAQLETSNVEGLCQCFANRVARRLADLDHVRRVHINGFQIEAYRHCGRRFR